MTLEVIAHSPGCEDGACPTLCRDLGTGDVVVRGYDTADPAIERDIRVPASDWAFSGRPAAAMSGGFDALFDEFRTTAFRFEARASYSVGGEEAERLHAYREHLPRPERSVRTSPWPARVAASTAAGKRWQRLRVLDSPPTDYQHYQLRSGSYLESQAAGDQTLLVDRASCGGFGTGPDFWLFDADTEHARAVVLDYSDPGTFEGFRVVDDEGQLRRFREVRSALAALAIPLNVYLAQSERLGA